MSDAELTGNSAGAPFVAAVAAPSGSQPWLLGGVVITPDGTRHVTMWTSSSIAGPWTRAGLNPIAGRDGPNETMLYFGRTPTKTVAFGSRASPTEAYPRPSAWVPVSSNDRSWNEILEPDPAFEGLSGEIPFASAIADSPRGLVAVGTAEVPSTSDPGRQRATIWVSATGRTWTRMFAAQIPALGAASTTLAGVATTSTGWTVAGTVTVDGQTRPAVWFITAGFRLEGPDLLPPPPGTGQLVVSSLAADATSELVTGLVGNQSVLWSSRLAHGRPSRWTAMTPPPTNPGSLRQTTAAEGPSGIVIALQGASTTQVWTASHS